jgi:hypothetical protein
VSVYVRFGGDWPEQDTERIILATCRSHDVAIDTRMLTVTADLRRLIRTVFRRSCPPLNWARGESAHAPLPQHRSPATPAKRPGILVVCALP